ncbi:MAG: DedA family rane protein type domain [Rickettsiaceae bacterium]|jgi:membrane protein DedA with SNARE-associated domain|nr:DedA family rane protein type domain [Rickettsiaceae bacterium]
METLAAYFQIILDYLVFLVDKIGYFGIFVGMFLESTFVPIPSEIIMIPAGIAAAEGKFNLTLAIVIGVIGNLLGAIFNYYLAIYCGRAIMLKIGKYFFIKEETIIWIEQFFKNHGSISTFTGRLIPVVRHYISLPAGIARMHFGKFCFYTLTGSAIWVTILTYLGFVIGQNKELIKKYLDLAILICLSICFLLVLVYIKFNKIKAVKSKSSSQN